MEEINKKVLDFIKKAREPVETTAITAAVGEPRHRVLGALFRMKGNDAIMGKMIGEGTSGRWIWWAVKKN